MKLKDKVIIITGASSGIGRALAVDLAKKGAKIVAAARRDEKLKTLVDEIKAVGGEAISVVTDVASRFQVDNLVLKSIHAFGQLDVFVANAGVTHAPLDLVDLPEAEFRRVMETNLMGTAFGVWAAAPVIAKSGGGMIVVVSSVVGKRGIAKNAAYCASKFALQGLTESIRPELKKLGIHLLNVCPPGVDTEFFEANGRGNARRFRLHSAEQISRMIVSAMEKNKREVLLTMDAKLLAWANIVAPSVLDWAISKRKGE